MDAEPITLLLVANDSEIYHSLRDLLLRGPTGAVSLQWSQDILEAKRAVENQEYSVCLLSSSFNKKASQDPLSKSLAAIKKTPIVLVSTDEDYELEIESMRDGVMDFFVLDQTSPSQLERIIRHTIARSRIESERAEYKELVKQAEERAAHLASIIDDADIAIKGKTLDGIITTWNRAAKELYGYTAEEIIGQPITKLLPPDRSDEAVGLLKQVSRGETIRTRETVRVAKDGSLLDVSLTVSPIRNSAGEITGASTITHDIRRRKNAEARIEGQIHRIQALRNIDMAITSSLDLRVTLNVLLDQVTTHLRVDSAAVLLLNSHTQRLEYSTGRGFRTTALQRTNLRLGEGCAGRAALERKVLTIPDLNNDNSEFTRKPMIAGEDFVSYWVAPLVTKGRVEGVLELYHRSALHGDDDWFNFLETLAGQAAIAIENAALFNGLQRTNLELQLAYDSTLEGWSKALDLRDKETEGHTLRVTESTTTLARSMNISDDDLVQIRRGSLLHDIGKMGIPDSILLKPGPLTPDEWLIMRQHPVYAYELLSPIPFLHGALGIPYCHHEKWDGSGYPRGLKGEQIPLSARIFAVIDVWDALKSKRPYRGSWQEAKVRKYIVDNRGTHFDPDVVEAFLAAEL